MAYCYSVRGTPEILSVMSKERIQYLLQRYAANEASRQEVQELFEWLKDQQGEDALKNFILQAQTDEEPDLSLPEQHWNNIWHSVQSATTRQLPKKNVRYLWTRMAAAALILGIAGSAWFYFSHQKTKATAIVTAAKKDITPGGNKALLTLADGSTIILDTVQNGLLALQGKTKIIKQTTGELLYSQLVSSEPTAGEVLYNTITTPAGGQYKLELPDGSKVWLNAGSSLYFPASFTGSKRIVKLTGEAYFEVAKVSREGKKRPFIVVIPPSASGAGGGEVEVLGTHFNVNAYNDESVIRTTLLEGKVKVSSSVTNQQQPPNPKLLLPGKQALLNSKTHTIRITEANTEQAVAWKNGFFRFKETGIHELMRQVARWYDVDVEYQTNRSDQYYTGVISRSQNISALLQMLELTGTVHFQIDNNPVNGKRGKIVVLP